MKKILYLMTGILLLSGMFLPSAYSLEGVEILSGYMEADLEGKGDYTGIPLLIGLNFDIKPWFAKIGLKSKGRIDFVLEPFVNTITGPDVNVEVGSNFLFKYVFPLSEVLQPYFRGGVGVLYMSQHTNEQSTQYNFLPQIGGGIHYFLNENTALTCEYRYRHLSNASTKSPNSGIDADMILGGIAIFFK